MIKTNNYTNSRAYDLLIFDWDGTIMDSTQIIATCIQKACIAIGQPKPSLTVSKQVIGLGLRDALFICAPNLSTKQYDLIFDEYHRLFIEEINNLSLFEGIEDQLNQLFKQGYLLAIATGKNRNGLNKVLEKTRLTHLFQTTRTPDETSAKPAPDMVLEIMQELHIKPDRTLMIGDTTHDINMAHHAQVDSFAVSQGAHSIDILKHSKPTYLAQHIQELMPWLNQLNN